MGEEFASGEPLGLAVGRVCRRLLAPTTMAAGAGDHLMLSRLGLGEEQAETAGSSTVLVHESVVNAVTFLSNGLLATAAGKVVALWDVNACAMKQTLNHEGTVNSLMINTEGNMLATCGNDRKVTTWSLPHGQKLKELSLDGWVRATAAVAALVFVLVRPPAVRVRT